MINGIPVKIARETENGTDCETAYFATFRKCPKLAELVRTIAKLETEGRKAERTREIAEDALRMASDAASVDKAASELDAATSRSIDSQDSVMAAFSEFVETGFQAAGYDKENAVRIAEAIPFDRMGELVRNARMGSGVCDFFSEPTRSGGK